MNHLFKQLVVPASASAASEAPAVVEGTNNTVKIAIIAPTDSLILDPLINTDTSAVYVAGLLYEPLMYVNATGEATNELAEKVDISDDKTTYTFTLRPDAKFQDGTILTAQYVKSSWERAQQLKSPVWAKVSSVEAIDDLTVTVTLKAPSEKFLIKETPYLPIVKESTNALQGNVIGAGPFKLADGTGTEPITLEPNPFYGDPQAFPVQQIKLRTITNNALALQGLNNGSINLVFGANQHELSLTELAPRTGKYLREFSDGGPVDRGGPGGRRPPRPKPPKPPKLELPLFEVQIDVTSELNHGSLPQSLLNRFQSNGIALSADAAVQVDQVGNTWTIVDKDTTRRLIKEGKTIIAYQELLPRQ